jgi:hypothetical protein
VHKIYLGARDTCFYSTTKTYINKDGTVRTLYVQGETGNTVGNAAVKKKVVEFKNRRAARRSQHD